MSDESAPDQARSVGLRLQADRLTFFDSTASDQGQRTLGPLASVRSGLEQGRLTGAGLESAIARVEDLIMPMIRTLFRSTELRVCGSELAEVLALLPAGDGVAVPIESVEGLFNQLADYAAGSAVAWRHAAPPGRVALGLVVVREVMHHGGFRSVSLLRDSA